MASGYTSLKLAALYSRRTKENVGRDSVESVALSQCVRVCVVLSEPLAFGCSLEFLQYLFGLFHFASKTENIMDDRAA